MKIPTHCYKCKRPFTEEEQAEKRRLKSERLSIAVQRNLAAGRPVGRERRFDYGRIYSLRDSGASIREITKKMGISRGAICYALRVRDEQKSTN